MTFDLQLCLCTFLRGQCLCPHAICDLNLNKADKNHVVLIMHYDFIFSFYYHFRGTGGMFIVKQFTYFCMR